MSEPCQLFLVLPLQFCQATLKPRALRCCKDQVFFPISPKISCPFSGQKHCQNSNQTMLIYTALFHLDKVQGFLCTIQQKATLRQPSFQIQFQKIQEFAWGFYKYLLICFAQSDDRQRSRYRVILIPHSDGLM